MVKMTMDGPFYENSTEWSFPDVDDNNSSSYSSGESPEPDEETRLRMQLEKQHAAAVAEVEAIKNDYLGRMQLLNALLAKLESPLAILDQEMMGLMQSIIKSAVKKIIDKEIETDAALLPGMIDELTAVLKTQEPVTILLSEADYNRLSKEAQNPARQLKMDATLREGDVIIKSSFTEVRAILDERIHQVLGTRHV